MSVSEKIPLVSVWMITYNHEKYIRKSIESVLMQETDFPVEIVIGEDCSTDGTREIIKELEAQYPTIIKPIYHEKNVGADRNAYEFCLPQLKGKYVACIEGDDYWLDSKKLQKQVDFLEKNIEYSMCFHNAMVEYSSKNDSHHFAQLEEREYYGEEILKSWTIPTASVVFRRSSLHFTHLFNDNYLFKDIILFLSLAEKGKIWCIDEVMSVYRRHDGGVSLSFDIVKAKKHIKHCEEIEKNFSGRYAKIEKEIICKSYIYLSLKEIKVALPDAVISLKKAFMKSPLLFCKNFPKIIFFEAKGMLKSL